MGISERSKFEQCALASGLLTEQQLDEARAGGRWSESDQPQDQAAVTDEQLADRLVELSRLNRWQAQQLLDGQTRFTLGSYRMTDSIGQGGMGQVFKAEHNVMGRVVAIKVLPLSRSTPDAVDNFTREIRALAGLNHPKLVRALDAGFDGNVYYLVTEYVAGGDLRKLVRRAGPLGMNAAADIIFQVAEGLHHAHQNGLIHRDVKPGNVLVTPDGEAKLSDLGLAGPLKDAAENDPRFGKIVGTADYLSPDQVESPWNPTPGWDIYSLGCTLYYAITGKVPFPGGTTSEKARAHCELRPLDPRRLNTALSNEFVDAMADMMAKDPAQRIPSAIAVMKRLLPWTSRAILEASGLALGLPPGSPKAVPPLLGVPVVAPPPIFPQMATPPPVTQPQPAAAQRPDEAALADTQLDFAMMPQAPPDGEEESSSEELQMAEPSGKLEFDTLAPPVSIVRPLLVLVPLALIAVVLLIWLLVQLVQ